MSVNDVFWIFFMFAAFQPLIQQKMLEAMRTRKIAQLEGQRNSRVILLVHRQETMRFLGFPLVRYIDINDSEEVLRAIHLTDDDMPLDIVLHTPGGLVLASLQIAYALREHKGKVTAFVPHYAMSGGTLLALSADEIVMSPHAVLGPIDPQVGGLPAASIIKVAAEKPLSEVDDHTLILADIGQKAIDQLKSQACELIRAPMTADAAKEIADKLVSGRWTHDYPISVNEAKALGLNINTAMPHEILELMALYPQPVRMGQSVEFGPGPGVPRR